MIPPRLKHITIEHSELKPIEIKKNITKTIPKFINTYLGFMFFKKLQKNKKIAVGNKNQNNGCKN